jgi:hypothetical protein
MAAPHINPAHKGLMHKDLGISSKKPLTLGDIMKEKSSSDPAKKKRGTFALMAKRGWKPLAKKKRFGDGGVVDEPTDAVIGDKGPEAVVPVDNKEQGMNLLRSFQVTRKNNGGETAVETTPGAPRDTIGRNYTPRTNYTPVPKK